jgi:hypothetical protein
VLWIDDAHEHFSYGLTLARLNKLRECHKGLMVAMTVHTERLQPPPRHAEAGELSSVDVPLLDHLAELAQDLATTLTAEEQAAARDAYWDLLAGIEHPVDFERLPSWFAGVDYLRDRYHRAGPAPMRRQGRRPRRHQLAARRQARRHQTTHSSANSLRSPSTNSTPARRSPTMVCRGFRGVA